MEHNIPETVTLMYGIIHNKVKLLHEKKLEGYKPHVEKWYNSYPSTFTQEKIKVYLSNRSLLYFIEEKKYEYDQQLYLMNDTAYNDAKCIVAGLYSIYLILTHKSNALVDYKHQVQHIIEDIVVALLLHNSTNALLLTCLQDAQAPAYTIQVDKDTFQEIYSAVTRANIYLDYNITGDTSNINSLTNIYPEYLIDKDQILKGLSLYDTISATTNYLKYKYDNSNSNITTPITDLYANKLSTVPSKVTLIGNLLTFLNESKDNYLIYLENDNKAISVKDMINLLAQDIQAYNCLAPKHISYNDCVSRRSNRNITEYTNSDLINMLTSIGDTEENVVILNVSSLPDDTYYANTDYLKKKEELQNLKAKTLAEYKNKASLIKSTIIKIADKLFEKRKEYIISLYSNEFIDFIENIYNGTIASRTNLDDNQCDIIINTYEKDIKDIMHLLKTMYLNSISTNSSN